MMPVSKKLSNAIVGIDLGFCGIKGEKELKPLKSWVE